MKVSVIIPTWNRSAIVGAAIKSAICQTYKPLEIIVVDDGSTDDTARVVSNLRNWNVKYIRISHSGLPSVTRNVGIKHSLGDWIAFLDSDDTWFKNKLELQVAHIMENNCDASCSNAIVVSNPTDMSSSSLLLTKKSSAVSFFELLLSNPVVCSSVLVNKSALRQCRGFSENESLRAIEDYDLWLRLSDKFKISYLEQPLVRYLASSNTSVRGKGIADVRMQKLEILRNFINMGKSHFIHSFFAQSYYQYLMYKTGVHD